MASLNRVAAVVGIKYCIISQLMLYYCAMISENIKEYKELLCQKLKRWI